MVNNRPKAHEVVHANCLSQPSHRDSSRKPDAGCLTQRYPDTHTPYSTFSTSRQVYWIKRGKRVIYSYSQGELQRYSGAQLEESRLASALCSNLPAPLRQQPFWQGIRVVPPGHALTLVNGCVKLRPLWKPLDAGNLTRKDAGVLLHDSLIQIIQGLSNKSLPMSCDLSGGMDSTSLAYLLNSLSDNPIFYHSSTADPYNQDKLYAARAAEELGGTFRELAPFSETMSAYNTHPEDFPSDSEDGPWEWSSNAKHLQRLLKDARDSGARIHLTGLGGDELFSPLPVLALALRSYGQFQRALKATITTARMQKWNVLSGLRAAYSRETWQTEVRRRSKRISLPVEGPEDAFSWVPGFGLSPFASQKSFELVSHQVECLFGQTSGPQFKDKFHHQMSEAIMFQGEVLRQMNQAFAKQGIQICAPFLDDRVLSLVMGIHPQLWAGNVQAKPLLLAAMKEVAPYWLFERRDKGEYSWDLFAEYKRRRIELKDFLLDGYLAGNCFIDSDKVVAALDSPTLGTERLFNLERIVNIERWARRNA